MRIFFKKNIRIASFLSLLLTISSCSKLNDGEPFSFYKTFVNPDYEEAKFDDYVDEIKITNEKVDLESVPDEVEND
ncbi:MAG: hypothetical protein ACKVKE_01260 [Candidatus Pelagibacterales bacterium]|jgi:hypothetical protein|tara:strand:+ start:7009 stop:7236 length:228 start_codon:yes stop_codon:yes gene_type:complete